MKKKTCYIPLHNGAVYEFARVPITPKTVSWFSEIDKADGEPLEPIVRLIERSLIRAGHTEEFIEQIFEDYFDMQAKDENVKSNFRKVLAFITRGEEPVQEAEGVPLSE